MRRKHKIKRTGIQQAELNITAFMNLMVVLVPFLLMTAVFSHLTIIELNLPDSASKSTTKKNEKKITHINVILKNNTIVLSDSTGNVIGKIDKKHKDTNNLLKKYLVQIKEKIPYVTAVNILSDKNIKYDEIISTMDASRSYKTNIDGEYVEVELFPSISLGDAP
ncbi:MAG: biopolymer transporter ExbD [Thioalkalispiraceae bacterium]|jgi:biopolymer transport protein ExbD